MSEEEMIEARDAFYSGLDKGDPRHWRDVGPDEIWEAAWRAAWNLRQQVPNVDWLSNVIREVDGNHSLGAGALAENIVEAMLSAAPKPEDVK